MASAGTAKSAPASNRCSRSRSSARPEASALPFRRHKFTAPGHLHPFERTSLPPYRPCDTIKSEVDFRHVQNTSVSTRQETETAAASGAGENWGENVGICPSDFPLSVLGTRPGRQWTSAHSQGSTPPTIAGGRRRRLYGPIRRCRDELDEAQPRLGVE